MAIAFAQNFSISQSSDGLTGTISDTSNYSTNTESITVASFTARSVVVLDAYGDAFTTVTFSGTSLTATFAISAGTNLWAASTMTWTGATSYTKFLEFPLGRATKNLYRILLKQGCCASCLVEKALNAADRFFRGADIESAAGNSTGWQTDIDAAYDYLNQYPTS